MDSSFKFFLYVKYTNFKIKTKKLFFYRFTQIYHFKNVKFNYVFKDFKFIDNNQNRKFDIIFYLRSHKNKNTLLNINLANSLSEKFNVVTIGEKIKNKNIINLGNINKNNLYNILQKTKYSLLSAENIYSFFALDCLSNGVHVFYHN